VRVAGQVGGDAAELLGVAFPELRAGLLLCAVLALLMATMAAFSIAAALTTKDINGFAAIINGLNLPVLLLGGVAGVRGAGAALCGRAGLGHLRGPHGRGLTPGRPPRRGPARQRG